MSTAPLSINGPIKVFLSSGLPIGSDLYAANNFLRTWSATDSCMMTRRVEVQRWLAVPTAPKKIDCVAICRSAVGQTSSALFPLSSMIVLANRPWTVFAMLHLIRDALVAEVQGIAVSPG